MFRPVDDYTRIRSHLYPDEASADITCNASKLAKTSARRVARHPIQDLEI
jgi:hypothetical protein